MTEEMEERGNGEKARKLLGRTQYTHSYNTGEGDMVTLKCSAETLRETYEQNK